MTVPRQVWRIAPLTLGIVVVFMLVSLVVIPTLAYLIYDHERTPWIPAMLIALTVLVLLYAWRFGLHPRIRADDRGVSVINPFRRTTFEWDDITVVVPGENGLVVASPTRRAEAWCVQKS